MIVPKDNSAELNAVARKVASGAADVIRSCVSQSCANAPLAQRTGYLDCGTTGEAATLVYDQDLSIPTALVMGAEGPGMRRLTTEACDFGQAANGG